jgi:hypothetical protein
MKKYVSKVRTVEAIQYVGETEYRVNTLLPPLIEGVRWHLTDSVNGSVVCPVVEQVNGEIVTVVHGDWLARIPGEANLAVYTDHDFHSWFDAETSVPSAPKPGRDLLDAASAAYYAYSGHWGSPGCMSFSRLSDNEQRAWMSAAMEAQGKDQSRLGEYEGITAE